MRNTFFLLALFAAVSISFGQFAPRSFNMQTTRALDDAPPEPRLSSNVIIDILPGSAPEEIWLGTGRGVTLLATHIVDEIGGGGGRVYEFRTWSSEQGLGRGGVSGMAVSDSIIWVSFAFDTTVGVSGAGGGLAYSRDNGESWTWFEQPQDRIYDLEPSGYDNVLGYWPTATNVDNITYAIAMSAEYVWSVSKGAGLRRHAYAESYTDYNDTTGWQVVTTDSFAFNPLAHLNHRCFALTYDGGAVWVGSANGISKSTDEGETWSRYTAASHGISGNFVTALAYQEATGAIWAATWAADGANETYAVSRTLDGGASWTVHLTGEDIEQAIGRPNVTARAHNFGFDGEDVYVADDLGLWKSTDMGENWDLFPLLADSVNTGLQFYESDIYAFHAGNGLMWTGGVEGVAVSQSNGLNWKLIQAALPLGDPSRSVDTYAYPNPYSPQRQEVVRIRFSSPGGPAKLSVYDFAMSEVVKLPAVTMPPGEQSLVWNGRKDGKIIANGTYFYKVEKPGGDVWGKLIILD